MSQIVPAPERPLARTLRDLIDNCDKDAPLASGDPRWQDLSPGRGDRATKMLVRDLEARQEGQFIHAAFVSHRGAGKSTEIRRVASQVEAAYHTVLIEATIEMDPLQIEAEDLLLNIALAVEAEMRRIGKPLSVDLLGSVEKWFAEVVRSTEWARGYSAEIAAGAEGKFEVPFLGSLFAQAKALMKHESDYRTEVKQILKKYPGSLIQSVNDLLDAAQASLGGRALLVVIDNLDRYEPASMDELLVAGADRIRSLRCNLILTPPISLHVEHAIARRKQRLRDQINVNGWWAALRGIAETKQITDDPKCLAVLFHRLAFKYNGEGWYDVHPLVAELKEFRP